MCTLMLMQLKIKYVLSDMKSYCLWSNDSFGSPDLDTKHFLVIITMIKAAANYKFWNRDIINEEADERTRFGLE